MNFQVLQGTWKFCFKGPHELLSIEFSNVARKDRELSNLSSTNEIVVIAARLAVKTVR
jgi:hypothetical protein